MDERIEILEYRQKRLSIERKARLSIELSLLQKTKWRWRDIACFYQCASAKANEIRKRALEAGGKIDYDPHAVQSRIVLALDGTTPETEIKKRYLELTGLENPNERNN